MQRISAKKMQQKRKLKMDEESKHQPWKIFESTIQQQKNNTTY